VKLRLHQIAWSAQRRKVIDARATALGSARTPRASRSEGFLFGLDRILDGVQTLIGHGPGSVMGP
jgi:hypothetical protein